MKEQKVILVDINDKPTGVAGKMKAHKNSLLHRAVSVFIVNTGGNWIIQRRSFDKYHSRGLWTNACCTHPFPEETSYDAAKRRLKEEMGIECELDELFTFLYKEKLDNDLTEHEYDHVFLGITDNLPEINAEEVDEWKAVSFNDIRADVCENPENYTYWFRVIYEKVQSFVLNKVL